MLAENTRDKYHKNNKCNKEGSQEGPRNVPRYRKNCKSNKQTLLLYIHTGLTFIVPVRNCVNTKRFPPYILN